jgi:hypothetical protein
MVFVARRAQGSNMALMSRAPKIGGAPAGQPAASGPVPGIGKQTLVQMAQAAAQAPAPVAMVPATRPVVGQSLPDDLRARMERAFGADFTSVRVSESPDAAALGALAYTRGTDIFVAPGHYDPTSRRGQELLAHELTHVVQQSQGRVPASAAGDGAALNADPALEQEADALGDRAARAEPVRAGAAPVIARPASHTAAPVQPKLNKLYPPLGQDRQLELGELVPVGTYLRDTVGHQTYRYVSMFPGADVVILSGHSVQGLFVYSFTTNAVADYDQWEHEVALGRDINREMARVNDSLGVDPTSGVHYEHTYQQDFPNAWNPAYTGGHADPQLFTRPAPMTWQLIAGHSASAALHAWLAGLTIAECGSVLVAIQLRELLQVLGAQKFDQLFGSAQPNTQPQLQLLTITSDLSRCIPEALIKGGGVTEQGGPALRLGAKYFFQNHSAYLRKHPDGALQGENAVYIGVDQQQQPPRHYFGGFGIARAHAAQMCNILRQAYNAERTEGDYRRILSDPDLSRVPMQTVQGELQAGRTFEEIYEARIDDTHPLYRIGNGGVPDQLSVQDWTADPESGIHSEGVMLHTGRLLAWLLGQMP